MENKKQKDILKNVTNVQVDFVFLFPVTPPTIVPIPPNAKLPTTALPSLLFVIVFPSSINSKSIDGVIGNKPVTTIL